VTGLIKAKNARGDEARKQVHSQEVAPVSGYLLEIYPSTQETEKSRCEKEEIDAHDA
jgi:hypothetical protein